MHSCGKIDAYIDSLIEVGVNVLNLEQPAFGSIEQFGRRFAGRVCLESLCDIQHTLPFASDDEIRERSAAADPLLGDVGGRLRPVRLRRRPGHPACRSKRSR